MGKMNYINEDQIRTLFPTRPADCHKGSFGYVALIGGSIEYSGGLSRQYAITPTSGTSATIAQRNHSEPRWYASRATQIMLNTYRITRQIMTIEKAICSSGVQS